MKRSIKIFLCSNFFIAFLLLFGTGAVNAADKSACIHFSSDSANVKLKLNQNSVVSCNLPFKYCGFKYDSEYNIVLWGKGYERREGRFIAGSDGKISIRGNKIETCLKNGILPGYGTYLREKEAASAIDFLSIAGSFYKFYRETDKYNDLTDRLELIKSELSKAETINSKMDLQKEAHKASIDVNLQNKYRKKILLFSSALYAYQLFEPIFMNNPPEVYSESSGSIRFKAIDRSISKAFIYSLLRPGRGQFYQGKKKRGLFFSSMVILSGFITLDLNNQYNINVIDYNYCMDKFNSAFTEGDRNIYRANASLLWDKVEDSKEKRNLSIYILTGLWGWNVIDTIFPNKKLSSNNNYSINVTPLGCELAVNF